MSIGPIAVSSRAFFISALLIALPLGLVGSGSSLPIPSAIAATGLTESEVFAANSIAIYPWNLGNDDLPLISLPDHLQGSLDLSLTYSMGQFQFPLFESLYFNQQIGKYILMVIPNGGGRAQFIDLKPVAGWTEFAATDNSGLRLADKGKL